MAKEEKATLILQIKEKGAAAIKGINNSLRNLKNAVLAPLSVSLAGVTAAIGNMALKAGEFNDVKRAFSNLASAQGQDANKMLAQMKELSAGTISELELMKRANNALLLGLPVDRFGDMLQIARSSAKATGQSMDFMLSSIVTGLGRGSKLMLDNLGIIIDTNKAYDEYAASIGTVASKLTDAEKKQAFINKALQIGKENAESSGTGALSLTERWEQFKVKISEVAIELGQKFAPAMETGLKWVNKMLDATKEVIAPETLPQLEKQLEALESRLNRMQSGAGSFLAFGERDVQRQIDATKKQIAVLQEKEAVEAENAENAKKRGEALREQKKVDAAIKEEMDKVDIENDIMNKQAKLENQRIHEEAMNNLKEQQRFQDINKEIAGAKDRNKKLEALSKRREMVKAEEVKVRKEHESNFYKFEQFLASQKVQTAQNTFATISTLQQAESKKLIAIGKAAAIANIIISTAAGVMNAYRFFDPITATVLGSLVVAAGAVQSAKVAGVQLAEGGIVKARPGGVQATIGEGGRDEAVIPLDDGGPALGSNVTFNFNGPLMGDEQQAREFARMIDRELSDLRQDNESMAFSGLP